MITREDIQNSARKVINAPWVHQGRNLTAGIDCLGVLIFVAEDLGYIQNSHVDKIDDLYRGIYARNPNSDLLYREILKYFDEIPIDEAKEGDVLLLRMVGTKFPRHVAIITRGSREYTLIHALDDTMQKRVVEEPYGRWKKFVTNAFQFRGIE